MRDWRTLLAVCALAGTTALALWHFSDRSAPSPEIPAASQLSPSSPFANVELCGYGSIKPIRSTDDYPTELVKAADRAFATVAEKLSAEAHPAKQSAGLYAKLVDAMRRAGDEYERKHPNCADEVCVQQRMKIASETAALHAEPLARLAVSTQDPVAYAIARFGCRMNRESGACVQLSAAGWSRIDTDNAVPWLYLADAAATRQDEAALDEALQRAARAKTSDYRWSTVLSMADHPIARELAPATRLIYLSQLFGIYAALPAPKYDAVNSACAADRIENSARRQTCADLATMMTERSMSVIELSIGTPIGERAGWPSDRVQRLRDETEAIHLSAQQEWLPDDVHSCRFLEQLEVRTKELLSSGELPSARQKLAASGRAVAAMAQEWRDLQREHTSALGKGGQSPSPTTRSRDK